MREPSIKRGWTLRTTSLEPVMPETASVVVFVLPSTSVEK
jgi:hypothetical protein